MNMKLLIQQLIVELNRFNVDGALKLFADNAVVDDDSVGMKFTKKAGVRQYLEKYFVGYKTVTKLESVKIAGEQYAEAKVDFTGDFGHETGTLNIHVSARRTHRAY